jgi:hypothetical protein
MAFLTSKSSSRLLLVCLRLTRMMTGSKTHSDGGIRKHPSLPLFVVDFRLSSSQVFSAKPANKPSSASPNDISILLAQRRARRTQQACPSSPIRPLDDDLYVEPPPPQRESGPTQEEQPLPLQSVPTVDEHPIPLQVPSSSQTLVTSSPGTSPAPKQPYKRRRKW